MISYQSFTKEKHATLLAVTNLMPRKIIKEIKQTDRKSKQN